MMYRRRPGGIEVLLVHPGGPYWAKKDAGAWSIPKGEFDEGESPLPVARREFQEETGAIAIGDAVPLGEVRLKGGKIVIAFAIEGDVDADKIVSNTFEIEWPPRSGRRRSYPEVDRAKWFSPDEAAAKINSGQRAFLTRLLTMLAPGSSR
jgi:predicted NUDIX family NTP pyrophosphohydrolase